MQMLQNAAIRILQRCGHSRLKEIGRDQAANQGGFGIGVLHNCFSFRKNQTNGAIIPQNIVAGYSQNDEIYDARQRGKEKL